MRHVLKRAGRCAALAVAGAGLVVGLAGCTGGTLDIGSKPRAPEDTIRVTPEDGAKGVGPEAPLLVKLPSGRLERVKVTRVEAAGRTDVPGSFSDDGLRWTPAEGTRLELAAKYSVDVVALDSHGRRTARHTTFTTAVPEHHFTAYFKPENRSTVGTGMIVSFTFNRPIENRAAVERAIRVTSSPPVEIAGHWFGYGRLDFRPQTYWKPGTRVTIDMRLRDVEAAPGAYGIQQKTIAFTVGRSQVSTVDAAAHTMRVVRDGQLLATVPITAGAPKTTTYNGKMVVTEMFDVTRMNGATVGFKKKDGKGEYDIKDVPHAIRLTTSGTFLHGNYWAAAETFGTANVSHGCVGLRDEKGGSSESPAGWFFDRTLIGDVVEVVNSKDRTVAPDNGLGGWNMDWPQWKEGSALE
ncbi:lipoprotein-anchoring transpeptidase ErfK/SrfK [Streptomyces sp. V4I23]|uniref:L,D-transpeptidase n=1 Tax=Streptomyces sp. V4I23 TaxID=3042282 RepID=UPI002781C797|nr:Ig-like domain-containing protein [Streptomyces sp. V4I23]MDQ1008193.1 lipoprotein-anchoring transpeptidase ErfK/SrfK [Streptomyces sp. V4I23]